MRVLLVDCFHQVNSKEFKIFNKLLRNWFAEASMRDAVGKVDITCRRLNNLYDYAIDWEYDMLDENGRKICKRFDCLSLVVVVGDMKITPWDMSCSQLITLLWMAELSKKPTLCCGTGAFAAVYSAAGQGTKFNILNLPNGESLQKLSRFPRYARPSGQFPGVWYENETGDLYKYNTQFKSWVPCCNIGIYRCASSGEPASDRFRRPVKHFSSADHALRAVRVPEAIDDEEFVAYVKSKFSDHFALKNLSTTSFACSLLPEWFLNDEGGLPCNGMCVAAETEKGPVVLVRELSVYITAKVGDHLNQSDVRMICSDYINHIVYTVSQKTDGYIGDSIFTFLFGDGGSNGGKYDSVKHKKVYTPALSQAHVKSFMPNGPQRVEPPLVTMFIQAPPEEIAPVRESSNEVGGKAQTKISFPVVNSPRATGKKKTDPGSPKSPAKNGSPPLSPRKPHAVCIREPSKNRKKRLAKFLSSVGHKSMLQLNTEAALEANRLDPYGLDTGNPDSARDIFSGLRMNTKNVFPRRPLPYENAKDFNIEPEGNAEYVEGVNRPPIEDDPEDRHEVGSDRGVDIFEEPAESTKKNTRPQSAHELSTSSKDVAKMTPNMITRGSSIVEGAMATNCLPIRRPQTAGRMPSAIEYLGRTSSKPFNNKQKYDELVEEESKKHVSEYYGMFRGGHLSSFEKEKKDYLDSKKKFLSGDFKRHFDKASRVPLRQEGVIRPSGAYPDSAPDSMHLKPTDWLFIRKTEKNKHVAHPWRPTTNKNSFNF